MGHDFSEYSELGVGVDIRPPVAPEDEFFHAVYISGQQRQNSFNEIEIPGKLQIRGVKSNLDEVNMIIVHIKTVLVKSSRTKDGRENLECFSYQEGTWTGTSGNQCGKNSIERAGNPFCNSCRSHMIVAGIYLDEKTKKPVMVNGQPIYIFIRSKGVKYGSVSNYIISLSSKDDLEPIFTPVTPETKKFERTQVNHKRFITKITVDKEKTNYGLKDIFKLEEVGNLSINDTKQILDKAKNTINNFKNKFDWSKNIPKSNYSPENQVEDNQMFKDFNKSQNPTKNETKPNISSVFDDLDF